jgi:hypothetical protein
MQLKQILIPSFGLLYQACGGVDLAQKYGAQLLVHVIPGIEEVSARESAGNNDRLCRAEANAEIARGLKGVMVRAGR